MSKEIKFEPHEIKAFETLKKISSECTLFLKRENDDFPLKKDDIKEIGLYGNGARKTLKGGTGSGDVEIHQFINIEQAFELDGIKVISKGWLDEYDKLYAKKKKEFVKRIKREAKEAKANPAVYCFGYMMEEPEYNFENHIKQSDINIYILSRQAGEGNDKKTIKGDFYLTDSEIRDIRYLNAHSKKFLLVINSGSLVDISPVLDELNNILFLSFLGSKTSETLLDIIFGRAYPSGKLAQTWDKLENYPSKDFGDINNTYYKEGIFVGYRHFATKEIKPLFPFGFGLSYTSFKVDFDSVEHNKDDFKITAKVKNIGNFKGKEVVQLYLSKPSTLKLINPKIELVGFIKTKELNPNEEEIVSISFKLSEFTSFNSELDMYLLPSGIYLLSLGNSSDNLEVVASIELKEEINVRKVMHLDEPSIEEYESQYVSSYSKHKNNIQIIKDDIKFEEVVYRNFDVKYLDEIEKLTNEELTSLAMGNISKGINGLIGASCESVLGGAGETTLNVKSIKKSLTLVDGPAGVRITKECVRCNNKTYKISTDPMWIEIFKYLPKGSKLILGNDKNRLKCGKRYFQYTTSLPVASALANSFSRDVAYEVGEIARREMVMYGCDVWLAPAMNIIRNPLCGRNFEYFSEDPFLTSEIASSIVESVQKEGNAFTCVKHFACNNQETNRFQSNSVLSIRTLREIYLRGFEKTIKNSKPLCVMTAYNLINGEHASQSSYLIKDILRNEFAFNGLVMSDWISTGQSNNYLSLNPSINAYKELKAGLNLVMPGSKNDILDIISALERGDITREELIINNSFIYKTIKEIKTK